MLQDVADAAFGREIDALTRTGRWDAALALLDSRRDLTTRTDVIRLRAALLHQLGRDREALALLESHLTRVPDDALSRFQLAEVHFAAQRDQAATLAYRLAVAGELDDLRRQVVAARLAAIHQRRELRLWVGASVAPDSNINSSTDALRVDLFGLPFELDENARRTSGISLSLFGGAERSFGYADQQAIRISLLGSLLDAPGAAFDTAALTLRAGPEWRFRQDSELTVQAVASQRWHGGDEFERRQGLFGGAEFGGQRTRWSGAVYVDKVDDRLSEARDGWMAGVDAVRTRYLSPSTLWRQGLSVSRKDAEAEPESHTSARASVGLLLPLPWSVAMYVEPYLMFRRHDAASIGFGEVRRDTEGGVAARFSKRDWTIAGAYPFVSVIVSQSNSTVSIGEFSRERIEIGLTREF